MTVNGSAEVAATDARNRATRTLVQGLLIDTAAGVVLAVGPMFWSDEFAFSRAYWTTMGLLAGKSALTALASYAMRRLVAPDRIPGSTPGSASGRS